MLVYEAKLKLCRLERLRGEYWRAMGMQSPWAALSPSNEPFRNDQSAGGRDGAALSASSQIPIALWLTVYLKKCVIASSEKLNTEHAIEFQSVMFNFK